MSVPIVARGFSGVASLALIYQTTASPNDHPYWQIHGLNTEWDTGGYSWGPTNGWGVDSRITEPGTAMESTVSVPSTVNPDTYQLMVRVTEGEDLNYYQALIEVPESPPPPDPGVGDDSCP